MPAADEREDFDFVSFMGAVRKRAERLSDPLLGAEALPFLERLLELGSLVFLPETVGIGAEMESLLGGLYSGSEPIQDRFREILDGYETRMERCGDPRLGGALRLLYSSAVVQCWAAFEFVSGSLWASVLDRYPNTLGEVAFGWALRRGKVDDFLLERIGRLRREGRQVLFGTALRRCADLTGLRAITEAYGSVFEGLTLLPDGHTDFLRRLNAARNAILHNSNRVDKKFQKLALWPEFSVGRKFGFDGPHVLLLASCVGDCGMRLAEGIDRWLLDFGKRPPLVQ